MISLAKMAPGSSQLEWIAAAQAHAAEESDIKGVPVDQGTRGSSQVPGELYDPEEDELLHEVSGIAIVHFQCRESSLPHPGDSVYCAGRIGHRWHAAEPGGYGLTVIEEKPESR